MEESTLRLLTLLNQQILTLYPSTATNTIMKATTVQRRTVIIKPRWSWNSTNYTFLMQASLCLDNIRRH